MGIVPSITNQINSNLMCLQKVRSTTIKSNITFLINASFSRQCPKTWRRRAMIFVFTDCWEVIFWRKKRGKTPSFRIYRPLPYCTRPGTGKTCSLHVTPSVEITPKIRAKIASLNSSIAFGDLRLGGCLRAPCSQAPARAQSPTRNTRIKRRNFRKDFWGYFDVPESEVYTSEFTVWAHYFSLSSPSILRFGEVSSRSSHTVVSTGVDPSCSVSSVSYCMILRCRTYIKVISHKNPS